MPFYKRLFDTMSQVIMPLDKTSSDEMSLDKMEVGKMPLDKMSFDKISSGKMPLDGILPSHCSHTSLLTTLSCHTNVNIFFTNFFLCVFRFFLCGKDSFPLGIVQITRFYHISSIFNTFFKLK